MKNILVILTDQQRKDSLGCYHAIKATLAVQLLDAILQTESKAPPQISHA